MNSKINAYQAIAHLPRTIKVAGAVMRDKRVNFIPKTLFMGSIIAIIALVVAPETVIDNAMLLVPGLGELFNAIGIPVEAAGDWLALGIAALNLMRLFPQEIVNEHFDAAVAKGKPNGPVVDADPVH